MNEPLAKDTFIRLRPDLPNSGLEIAPVSGAFANKDFAVATKISPLVAILRPFYSLASL